VSDKKKSFFTRTVIETPTRPLSDFNKEQVRQNSLKMHGETRECRFQNFLSKSKEVHGDKYDYSKVEFVNGTRKVFIICSIHGEFEQIPKTHMNGIGCRLCGYKQLSKTKVSNRDWISDFKKVWGDKIDYSKFQYVEANTKGTFICREHGEEFQQGIYLHLKGGDGCPICKKSKRKELMTRINKSRKKT